MIRLNTSEIERRLKSIQVLLDVKQSHPSIDARKTMDMIGEIIFPKEDIATELPVETEVNTKRPAILKKYNNKTELIGKIGTNNKKALERYGDNPWGVKVGTYQKCERCNKVGIVAITLDTHPGDKNPVTRLYKRLTHDNYETHNILVWKVEGTHDYEHLVEKWMKEH